MIMRCTNLCFTLLYLQPTVLSSALPLHHHHSVNERFVYVPMCTPLQITKKCNESARDLENREHLNEISKNLVFKKVKVSNVLMFQNCNKSVTGKITVTQTTEMCTDE